MIDSAPMDSGNVMGDSAALIGLFDMLVGSRSSATSQSTTDGKLKRLVRKSNREEMTEPLTSFKGVPRGKEEGY